MNHLIQQYQKSLTAFLCEDIIDNFNCSENKLLIVKNHPDWINIEKSVYKELLNNLYTYKQFLINNNNIPNNLLGYLNYPLYTNNFIVYKYCHGESFNHNCRTNNRYNVLSYIIFLNNLDMGGEIVFNALTIKPEIGKIILFPDDIDYKFIHNGPINSEQYIIYGNIYYNINTIL